MEQERQLQFLLALRLERQGQFRLACKSGHINYARYLIREGPDIHFNDDAAFRLACRGGHIKVVRWLVNLGADIHASGVNAFTVAYWNGFCSKRCSEVARFLISLEPMHGQFKNIPKEYLPLREKAYQRHLKLLLEVLPLPKGIIKYVIIPFSKYPKYPSIKQN